RRMAPADYDLPPAVLQAGDHYRVSLDSVRGFVTEECHFHPNGFADRAELYRTYRQWWLDAGRRARANTTSNARLEEAYGTRLQLRKRVGRPGWLGLNMGPDL